MYSSFKKRYKSYKFKIRLDETDYIYIPILYKLLNILITCLTSAIFGILFALRRRLRFDFLPVIIIDIDDDGVGVKIVVF